MFDAAVNNFHSTVEYINQVGAENISQEEWDDISQHIYRMTDEFINEFAKYLNWFYLTQTQNLTEATIEKHFAKIYWQFVAKHQTNLSEPFIEKWANFLNWDDIARYQQNLSIEFIIKHMDKLPLDLVHKNDNADIWIEIRYIDRKTKKVLKKETCI